MSLQRTDEELDVLLDVSQPVPWGRPREEFLATLVASLQASGERGPGAVHRAAARVQGQFLVAMRQEAERASEARFTFNRKRHAFSKLQEL